MFKSDDILAQIKVRKLGDVYEKEADRVAEKVMCMPEFEIHRQKEKDVAQSKPISDQMTPIVQRQTPEEEEEAVQATSGNETPMQRQEVEPMEEGEEPIQTKRG